LLVPVGVVLRVRLVRCVRLVGLLVLLVFSAGVLSHSSLAMRTWLTCMALIDEKQSVADLLTRPWPS
jgi:hypothetical protein